MIGSEILCRRKVVNFCSGIAQHLTVQILIINMAEAFTGWLRTLYNVRWLLSKIEPCNMDLNQLTHLKTLSVCFRM